MDKIRLHDEAYSRALELNKQGKHEEAARYARDALRLAREISATAGIPYSSSTAETLLELIENDLRATRMAAGGDIGTLLRDLGTPEWPQAVKALKAIGRPAVLPLCEFIRNSTADIKRRGLAASALGEIGDPGAIDPLLKLLRERALSPDKYAMRNLLFALERFDDARIAKGVEPFLSEKDPDIREAAAVVLEKYAVRKGSGGDIHRHNAHTHDVRRKWWEFWKRSFLDLTTPARLKQSTGRKTC